MRMPTPHMIRILALALAACGLAAMAPPAAQLASAEPQTLPYPIVATGQNSCYSDWREIPPPAPGQPFYGQDAQYPRLQPAYKDNGDGTVSDLNTGLMWVKAREGKVTYPTALAGAATCRVGGYQDWRMPTIKELYSLISFNGAFRMSAAASTPYIDTRYFGFTFGNEAQGERGIDCQDWSATQYLGRTMGNNATVFGVNFADGRIKGYPRDFGPRGQAQMYARYVRGNPAYGKNDYHDNGDGTVTDRATGLVWAKKDCGKGMNWETALAWVQARNADKYLGYSDWRMPNAKELQSIVDYMRAPVVTHSPAIDPVFDTTVIRDGEYPFYWTSTTHLDGPPERAGGAAIYVAFGRAWGCMFGQWLDVHGAGAQRSDPKSGDPTQFTYGRGPQGDQIRINNFVRPVRGGLPQK